MRLVSHISFIKALKAGVEISYGGTYKTVKPTRVATIPAGYADGYPRNLSGRGVFLSTGKGADPGANLYGSVYGGCHRHSGSAGFLTKQSFWAVRGKRTFRRKSSENSADALITSLSAIFQARAPELHQAHRCLNRLIISDKDAIF